MILAATGHRPNKLGHDYELTGEICSRIRNELENIICDYRPSKMISGMALGVDTIWAELALKHNYPLIAAIPFRGQEDAWPQASRDRYNKILNHPLTQKYIVSSGGYSSHKMQIRNEWMVDNCDVLVAVWDGSEGGTGNCVIYAESIYKQIIRVIP